MPGLDIRTNHYAPGERHARHAHAYTNVSLVLAGALVERVGRTEEYASALSVVVKPAGTEHADVFGPAGATLLQLLVPGECVVHSADRWRWMRSFATARWMLRIAARSADDAGDNDDNDDNDDTSDALAECLGTLDGTSTEQPERAPQWLQRVRERIADECTVRVRVSDLARDAGVHPVHLTRQFRRYYGTSVVGCVQLHRVRRAADALAGSSAPISHVALSAGFADQSHLTRVFKRGLGVTPGAFRTGAARASV